MIMSQHIILSLHDWRAASSGGGPDTSRNLTSNHELGPVSYAGHYPGGAGTNVVVGPNGRRVGPLGASAGAGVPGFNSHSNPNAITSVQLGGARDNNRRNSKHANSQNGTKSFMKDFVRSKRGSSEEDLEETASGALEIRVQVDEEVKLDYDSMYPGGDLTPNDNVSYTVYFSYPPFPDGWRMALYSSCGVDGLLMCVRVSLGSAF